MKNTSTLTTPVSPHEADLHEGDPDVDDKGEVIPGTVRRNEWGSRFVLFESSRLRKYWNYVFWPVLIYIGTVFPTRLCFVDFSPNEFWAGKSHDDPWDTFETISVVVFWIDLVINFFTTYRDSRDREVGDLRLIVRRYLCGWFFVNLVACLPGAVFGWIIQQITQTKSDSAVNQSLRLARLQRTSRLARLIRFSRMFKLANLVHSPLWAWVQSFRGMRLLNFTVGLFWVVHIMACAWFLLGALQDDMTQSWLVRRIINPEGDTLEYADPLIQWITSVYFILTVFFTIGFGDIVPVATSEVCFVIIIMIMGTVAHSVIMSEMISTLTSMGKEEAEIGKQMELVQMFAKHSGIDKRLMDFMSNCIKVNARGMNQDTDKSEFRRLLTSSLLPRAIVGMLPEHLFNGHLLPNEIFRPRGASPFANRVQHVHGNPMPSVSNPPPRLPLLVAAACQCRVFEGKEVLHYTVDQALSLYIVLKGTFANVAKPDPAGGLAALPPAAVAMADVGHFTTGLSVTATSANGRQHLFPYQLFGQSSYFGEYELLMGGVPRAACARCESEEGGTALVLSKSDFLRLAEEFPRFGISWRTAARRREQARRRMLRHHTRGRSYKNLAAYRIQAYWLFINTSRSRSVSLAEGGQWWASCAGSKGSNKRGLQSDPSTDFRVLTVLPAKHTGTSTMLADSTTAKEMREFQKEMEGLKSQLAGVHNMLESLKEDMSRVLAVEEIL